MSIDSRNVRTLILKAQPRAKRVFQLFFQLPQIIECKGQPVLSYSFERDREGDLQATICFEADTREYINIRDVIKNHHFVSYTPVEFEELTKKLSRYKKSKEVDVQDTRTFANLYVHYPDTPPMPVYISTTSIPDDINEIDDTCVTAVHDYETEVTEEPGEIDCD